MSQITITLPDQSKRQFKQGVTPLDVARSIGPRLAKDTVAASINGALKDVTAPIMKNVELTLHTGNSEEGHEVLLHSTAHLMAQAVKILYPNAKVTIGPAIENRFYYDFDIDGTFSDEDLVKIENKMKELSNQDLLVSRRELERDEAIKIFKEMDEDLSLIHI